MRNPDEKLYAWLTNEEDARLCDDISEAACRATPRSFVLILLSYFLTKLGDAIASPKTTLAWICTMLGTPAFDSCRWRTSCSAWRTAACASAARATWSISAAATCAPTTWPSATA